MNERTNEREETQRRQHRQVEKREKSENQYYCEDGSRSEVRITGESRWVYSLKRLAVVSHRCRG